MLCVEYRLLHRDKPYVNRFDYLVSYNRDIIEVEVIHQLRFDDDIFLPSTEIGQEYPNTRLDDEWAFTYKNLNIDIKLFHVIIAKKTYQIDASSRENNISFEMDIREMSNTRSIIADRVCQLIKIVGGDIDIQYVDISKHKTGDGRYKDVHCAICLQDYSDPINLLCGHVFCSGCYKQLITPRCVYKCMQSSAGQKFKIHKEMCMRCSYVQCTRISFRHGSYKFL